MAQKPDLAQLRSFALLKGMKRDTLRAILDKTEILKARRGQTLFKRGDKSKQTIYLLAGTIILKDGDEVVGTITGGTDKASNPIDPIVPRQRTAVAEGPVEYISLDSDFLDVTLTWDQTGIYEVSDFDADALEDTGDWMAAFLNTRAFQEIPPANIQSIFMRLDQRNYKAGDVVIQQGSAGEFFCVISSGRCTVTRETPLKADGIVLAKLGVGDTFGEESLLAETKCNATVTMQTDGSVMRLGKRDFRELLKEPVLEWVNEEEAAAVIDSGGQWIDVRLPIEFKAAHEEGALNLPLYLLRRELDSLDTEKQYVVCCDTGRRSSAAAFILKQRGFQAVVLTGGLNALKAKEQGQPPAR